MRRIHGYGGRPATRNLTVVAPRAGITMTQASSGLVGEAAGIGQIAIAVLDIAEVRPAAPVTPATGGRTMAQHVTGNGFPGTAIRCAERGADAVWTPPGQPTSGRLAVEGPCVRGHPGSLPRSSTRIGMPWVTGNTAADAVRSRAVVCPLGDAGASAAELECIEAEALGETGRRSGLATRSIGAGSGGNITLSFMQDICGDVGNPPHRARAEESPGAVTGFSDAARSGSRLHEPRRVPVIAEEHEPFSWRFDRCQPADR